MENVFEGFAWWVTAVEIPIITGLFWLIWRTREESESAVERLQSQLNQRCSQLREALGAFKLEVAKTYACHTDLRELETRLVEHLLRIEMKLDKTALKAAETAAFKKGTE